MKMDKTLSSAASVVVSIALMLVTLYIIIFSTMYFYGVGMDFINNYTTDGEFLEQTIVVNYEGTVVNDLADELAQLGIINSALLFRLENTLKRTNYSVATGTYTFNTYMDANDIIYELRQAR